MEVVGCKTADEMMSICESRLSEFSSVGTLAAVQQLADCTDNFKVRRDVSFSLLLSRTADVLGVLSATPEELVSTSWAVAKLGLRNAPLLNSIASAALTRLAQFSAQQLASFAWSFALLSV